MKARFIVIAGLILLGIGIYYYAQNKATATGEVNSIVAKDNGGVDETTDINNLKTYVAAHMHSSVKFTLTGAYQRAVKAAQTASNPQAPNSQLYAQAQAACASHADSITQANCVINYLNAHQASSGPAAAIPAATPDQSKYSYTFVAPAWSWDAAGIFLASGAIVLIAGLGYGLATKRW